MNANGDGPLDIDIDKINQWINFYEAHHISYLALAVQSKEESFSIFKPSDDWNDLREWDLLFKKQLLPSSKSIFI
jgi:hypothetical protein